MIGRTSRETIVEFSRNSKGQLCTEVSFFIGGNKGRAVCHKDDTESPYIGYCVAFTKMILGADFPNGFIPKALNEPDKNGWHIHLNGDIPGVSDNEEYEILLRDGYRGLVKRGDSAWLKSVGVSNKIVKYRMRKDSDGFIYNYKVGVPPELKDSDVIEYRTKCDKTFIGKRLVRDLDFNIATHHIDFIPSWRKVVPKWKRYNITAFTNPAPGKQVSVVMRNNTEFVDVSSSSITWDRHHTSPDRVIDYKVLD